MRKSKCGHSGRDTSEVTKHRARRLAGPDGILMNFARYSPVSSSMKNCANSHQRSRRRARKIRKLLRAALRIWEKKNRYR